MMLGGSSLGVVYKRPCGCNEAPVICNTILRLLPMLLLPARSRRVFFPR